MKAFLPRSQRFLRSTVVGIPESRKALRNLSKAAQKGAEKGVKKATKFLLKETLKVTPIKTGKLRKSGQTRYTGKGYKKVGKIWFTARYAIYVHEDESKKHESPTRSKFLQATMWKYRKTTREIVEFEIAKAEYGVRMAKSKYPNLPVR